MIRMASYQLDVALPVLARAAREWGPWPELDEIVNELGGVARRRGMISLLARLERQANGEPLTPQANGGPVQASPVDPMPPALPGEKVEP